MPDLAVNLCESTTDFWPRVPRLMSYPSLAIDIETTGLDPYTSDIICIQIANGVNNEVDIIDVRRDNFQGFFNILNTYKGLIYFQNGKFDLEFLLSNYGFLYPERIYDTMIAEKLLDGGRRKKGFSLEALSKKYLDIEMNKGVRDEFTLPLFSGLGLTDAQIRYGALDAWVLPRIAEKQRPILNQEVPDRVLDLEFSIIPVVAKAELKGFKLDVEGWTRIYEEEKRNCQILAAKLREMSDRPTFNPNAPEQVKAIMQEMDIPIPVLRGKETTDGKLLALLENEFTDTLLEYRKSSKRVSTYGEDFLKNINPVTGRIHPTFDQLGTDTGRFSSEGPNLQNIPKRRGGTKFRKCFVAPNGKDIISADFTGQEIMVMAEASQDSALIQIYLDGRDRHTATASMLFGVPDDEITFDQRVLAKTFNFGVSYGSTEYNMARQLKMPAEQVKKHLDDYWSIYGTLQKWTRRTGLLAWHQGYSETFWGRKRYYDTDFLRKDEVMRRGTNHRIQGTSADMTKLAIRKVDRLFRSHASGAFMHNFVHDEVEAESPEVWSGELAEEIKLLMEEAGKEFVTVLEQRADVKVGKYWM